MEEIEKLVKIFSSFYVPAIDVADTEYFLSSTEIADTISDSLGVRFGISDINKAMNNAGFKLHMTKPFHFEWMIKKISVLNMPLIE